MNLADLVRLALVAVVGATVLAAADVQLGIEAVDQLVDVLDVRQYL